MHLLAVSVHKPAFSRETSHSRTGLLTVFGALITGGRTSCAICPTNALSPGNESSHWNCQRHRTRSALFRRNGVTVSRSGSLVCCSCVFQDPAAALLHINSRAHGAVRPQVAAPPGFVLNGSNFYCTLCRRQFPEHRRALQHAVSPRHRSRARLADEAKRAMNVGGVTITTPSFPILAPGESATVKFVVWNESQTSGCLLEWVRVVCSRDSDGRFVLTDRQGALQEHKNLRFVENSWADIFLVCRAPTAPGILGQIRLPRLFD